MDPDDGIVHLRFAYLPILEDGKPQKIEQFALYEEEETRNLGGLLRLDPTATNLYGDGFTAQKGAFSREWR